MLSRFEQVFTRDGWLVGYGKLVVRSGLASHSCHLRQLATAGMIYDAVLTFKFQDFQECDLFLTNTPHSFFIACSVNVSWVYASQAMYILSSHGLHLPRLSNG